MLGSLNLLNINVDANIFFILAIIFLTGFLSGLSPCSLPTVALVVAYVSSKKNEKKSQGFIISLFFVSGIALTLTILGLFAGSFGRLFINSKLLMYIIAITLVFIGLWMLKLFNIGKGSLMEKMNVKKQSGVLGAFLLGIPFGIAASPCTMPVTIGVLAFAAAKGSIIYGMIFMFIFAIGRSIPIIIAGTFTGLLKKAKFLNKYEKVFEITGGIALVLIGFYIAITV